MFSLSHGLGSYVAATVQGSLAVLPPIQELALAIEGRIKNTRVVGTFRTIMAVCERMVIFFRSLCRYRVLRVSDRFPTERTLDAFRMKTICCKMLLKSCAR